MRSEVRFFLAPLSLTCESVAGARSLKAPGRGQGAGTRHRERLLRSFWSRAGPSARLDRPDLGHGAPPPATLRQPGREPRGVRGASLSRQRRRPSWRRTALAASTAALRRHPRAGRAARERRRAPRTTGWSTACPTAQRAGSRLRDSRRDRGMRSSRGGLVPRKSRG